MTDRPLRILFATPAYWPAAAFGGPIQKLRELAGGLAEAGHEVQVVTTSLVDIDGGRSLHTTRQLVDGARVRYVATPARYRWMGITPTLPLVLRSLPRPDVAHVFGYRDVVGTTTALWCRGARVPYVFEPLGMFRARLRKVALKRALDAGAFRSVPRHSELVIATSERERADVVAGGIDPARVVVRPNGFPAPPPPGENGALRSRLGIGDAPVALYVGRIAAGKGIEFLVDAARSLPDLHVVLAGPDDGHGTAALVREAERAGETAGRVHWLGPQERPLALYPEADVVVLASEGESFGSAAAEGAASGSAVVVTDRCGIAELLGPRDAAVVVGYERDRVVSAIRDLVGDPDRRRRLGERAREVAAEHSWPQVVASQEAIYRRVLAAR